MWNSCEHLAFLPEYNECLPSQHGIVVIRSVWDCNTERACMIVFPFACMCIVVLFPVIFKGKKLKVLGNCICMKYNLYKGSSHIVYALTIFLAATPSDQRQPSSCLELPFISG